MKWFNVSYWTAVRSSVLIILALVYADALGQCPLFAPAVNYGVGDGPFHIFAGDLNGDTFYDLVVANSGSSNITIRFNAGDGTFPDSAVYGGLGTPTPGGVDGADLDNDGDIDLAIAGLSTTVFSTLWNDGSGTLSMLVFHFLEAGASDVDLADFNNDGDTDLVATGFFGNVLRVALNNGDSTFGLPESYSSGKYPGDDCTADFNGDGFCDVATGCNDFDNTSDSDVYVYLNNGDGTLATAVRYEVDAGWVIVSGDFDGDTWPDLAVTNYNLAIVSVLLNNGDESGTFATPVNYGVGLHPWGVFASDLDNDGEKDLAVTNYSLNTVSILLNNGGGTGTFADSINFDVGWGPNRIFSADFDNDGDFDLAVANLNSDNVSILINLTINNLPDTDDDGIVDLCDACPLDPLNDADADDSCANVDNCPTVFNPGQENTDGIGLGDACCCVTPRGDCNGDGANGNILDLNYLVNRIFRGGPAVGCPKEGDCNSDGSNGNILDLNYLVNRIFRGGPAPGTC